MGSGQERPQKGKASPRTIATTSPSSLEIGEDAGSPLILRDAEVCTTVTSGYTYSATPAPAVQEGPWVNYFYYGGDPTTPILPPPSFSVLPQPNRK